MDNVIKYLVEVIHSRSVFGWIMIDKDYKIIYANDTICNKIKKDRNQIMNQSLLELLYEGEKQNFAGEYLAPIFRTMETKEELRMAEAYLPNHEQGQAGVRYFANTYVITDEKQQAVYLSGSCWQNEANKTLGQNLDQTNLSVIKAFCKAMGSRDCYTMEHEQKVATLLAGFSTYLNFSESEVRKLYLTAIVHDIGKIAIPEVILNKPGHLSKEEYTIIKRHPVIGSAILGEIDGFLQIATIVRHHHERFDGRGYPEGLAGDKIHLYSKMLAVCDSFDAMTSKRCYRNANTVQQALQEINECSGTQFDPKVCTMFIEYIKTKIDNTESA